MLFRSFGAAPYLQEAFGVDRYMAKEILLDWMENYGKRKEGQPDESTAVVETPQRI